MPNTREKLIELLINSPGLEVLFGSEEEFAKNADWLIANGVTIQKWIPVAERLPENEGRYLCARLIGKSGAVYVRVMNGDRYGFSLEHIYDDDVTHWMPLPKPPKGEKE